MGDMPISNLFADVSQHLPGKLFITALDAANFRIERIVSRGARLTDEFWFDHDQYERVSALKGAARLHFEGIAHPIETESSDFMDISVHTRHRVDWATPDERAI